jgi:uncharacterized membrane protein
MDGFGQPILFLFTYSFALVQFEIILLSAIPKMSIANGMNSEWIGKMGLTALAILFLYIMAIGMNRFGSKMNIQFVFFMFIFQSLILLLKEFTELFQMLFSLQILPLTMWALEILAPVVNHKDYFFYLLALTIILFLFFSSNFIIRYLKKKVHCTIK